MTGRPFAMTDEQMLTLLDETERGGKTAAQMAQRMGTSRSAVLGLLKRIRDDLAKSEVAPFAPRRGSGRVARQSRWRPWRAVVEARACDTSGGVMTALIDIGASGAKRATVQASRDFDLCGLRIVVVMVEGAVQIAFLADGWPGGARKVLSNVFCDAATPAQLRAITDHLDGLPLEGAV